MALEQGQAQHQHQQWGRQQNAKHCSGDRPAPAAEAAQLGQPLMQGRARRAGDHKDWEEDPAAPAGG